MRHLRASWTERDGKFNELAFRIPTNIKTAYFHPGNILFRIPNMDLWTVEQVYPFFGESLKVEIIRLDRQPPARHMQFILRILKC
jgi:hypothetical protein